MIIKVIIIIIKDLIHKMQANNELVKFRKERENRQKNKNYA